LVELGTWNPEVGKGETHVEGALRVVGMGHLSLMFIHAASNMCYKFQGRQRFTTTWLHFHQTHQINSPHTQVTSVDEFGMCTICC